MNPVNRPLLSTMLCAALILGGCNAREDEEPSTTSAATYDADGDLLSGNPELAAAIPESWQLELYSDSVSVETGSENAEVMIVARLKDDNNLAVGGETISFRATGGLLRIDSATTAANGELVARLDLGTEYRNRDVTVTATINDVSETLLIKVIGSTLSVEGPGTVMIGDSADYLITLRDGTGEPIVNREVLVSSAQGQPLNLSAAKTDLDGRISLSLPEVIGDDTLSFSALDGTVLAVQELAATTDMIEINDVVDGQEIAVGAISDVKVTWMRNGQPVVNEPVRFSLTAGQLRSSPQVNTDAAGQAVATLSSNSAGKTQLTIETFDGGPSTSIELQFVATTPELMTLSIENTRVASGSSSDISVRVTDANGNPVKNQPVIFTSPDLHGGQLSPSTAVSDADGVARTVFTAGSKATDFEAVIIGAEVEGTQVADSDRLTVYKRVLNVTLGTANQISVSNYATQYSVPFVVQVADGGGAPMADALVEVSITPVRYYKGYMRQVDEEGLLNSAADEDWRADHWAQFLEPCESEDQNGNRLLDVGEDLNDNDVLDPQDPALLAPIGTVPEETLNGGTLQTNSSGSGYFKVVYPASNAGWSDVEVTAWARESGAEAEDTFRFHLGIPNSVLENTDDSPASVLSPYGVSFDCTNTD